MPGTYMRLPVSLPDWSFGIPSYALGTVESVGLSVRALTYGELETLGGYGSVPYGATALYRGETLLEIR
jgi:hypothetical protein